MGSIVPPPPSIRLAPRSGTPRKRPGENNSSNPPEGK
jgi:hypothetical protein